MAKSVQIDAAQQVETVMINRIDWPGGVEKAHGFLQSNAPKSSRVGQAVGANLETSRGFVPAVPLQQMGHLVERAGDVERWMQADIEQVRERVNKAVYAGLVRIGGESLRIKEMVAEGETVKGWLTKMARHILTHPIEPAK